MEKRIADRLVECRKKAGYSQEELADAIGVSRQAVSKWERCESSPDTDNLLQLARLYHISLDDLVNGDAAPQRDDPSEKTERVDIKEATDGYVWEDDGMTVEIKESEITVKNEDGEEKTYDKAAWKRKKAKERRINVTVSSVFTLLAVITYLLLGFYVKGGWECAWPIFLLIPFVASLVEFCFYKRLAVIAFPCLVAAIYCFVGMTFGLWHPTWAMFISIPAYYLIAGNVDRATRSHDYEAIDDAFNKKDGKNNH